MSRPKIFRKGKKDKRVRRRLHKLLYQKQKHLKHLKSLVRENPELMMVYLTKITSSSNHGMMLLFNLMIRGLEKLSNQLKRVRHIHTWAHIVQLMLHWKIFKLMIQNWLWIVLLLKLHLKPLLRSSKWILLISITFRKMESMWLNLQIDFWLLKSKDQNRL